MHRTRLPIIAALAALLLAGCGKDAAPGTSGATSGKTACRKPDAVSGSVTGMPNPGESTPNPGQPVDVPPVDEDPDDPAEAGAPVDGELPRRRSTACRRPPRRSRRNRRRCRCRRRSPPTPANGGDTGKPGAEPQ
jgi:hypothetical protein